MLSSHLLHTIGELVLRVSPTGEMLEYAGPQELLTVSPEVFKGRSLSELLPQPFAVTAQECVRDVAATGGVKNFECSLPSETGALRHFGGVVARVDDGHLLLILRNVQAAKEAELKAQESEARFRIMADQAPAMLWMAGIDGECAFFNKTWLEFTGRTLEQELGVGWAEGVYFEDLQGCMKTYLDSFVARASFKMEYRLRNARGEYRWLLDHGVPRYTPDGTFAGFIGSCVDVTDSKLAAEITRQHTQQLTASLAEREGLLHKLEKRSTELARSNTELEQFVYAASHDLRAPLRAIHMLSEWISKDLGGGANQDVLNQLSLLRKRVARMTTLLDDLLAYSRAGDLEDAARDIDTGQLLNEVIEMLAPPSGFTIEIASQMPHVEAAIGPLKQVFSNLLGNAVVHHDQQHGNVRVESHDKGEFIEFRISDDGPGIPPRFHDRVFQMFQTLQPRDKMEGSGIGLALVKKRVESVGGHIALKSDGRGCLFQFTWPKRWVHHRANGVAE